MGFLGRGGGGENPKMKEGEREAGLTFAAHLFSASAAAPGLQRSSAPGKQKVAVLGACNNVPRSLSSPCSSSRVRRPAPDTVRSLQACEPAGSDLPKRVESESWGAHDLLPGHHYESDLRVGRATVLQDSKVDGGPTCRWATDPSLHLPSVC
jgi:hypothetical protein